MNKHIRSARDNSDFYSYDMWVGIAIVLLSLLLTTISFGQSVGLNNPAPHPKSILDLTATDRGFLAPRMTMAQRLLLFPAPDATAKGMLVYQTDNTIGFYYYDGALWNFLTTNNSGWMLGGNLGTNSNVNYIGSADLQDVVLKSNNAEVMRLKPGNKLQLGSSNFTPSYSFARLSIADNNGLNSDIDVRVAGGAYGQLIFDQSGGTIAAPTASANGQWSGVIVGRSYDGTAFQNTSAMIFGIDSAVAPGIMRSNIMFQTSGGTQPEKMRIMRNGNVGIGTTAPINKLEVQNNDSGWTTASFQNTNNKGWSGAWFVGAAGTLAAHFGYGNNGAPKWGGAAYAGSIVSVPFILTTADQERARIDAAGNMGIGQTTPVQKLDVSGNVNLGNDTNNIRINNVRAFSVNGVGNLFAGETAGIANIANNNTFVGHAAGYQSATGPNNCFIGTNAGYNNLSGFTNTYVGAFSGQANQLAGQNTFIGFNSGILCTSGQNTFAGANAGGSNTTGYSNVFIGDSAGFGNTTGDNNIYIGEGADGSNTNLKNAIAIGSNSIVGASNSMVLGGTGASAVKVGIGVTTPSAELEVNGFTKLGSNAPAIKTIKFTGTTAATQGGTVSFLHGLNSNKVLSVMLQIEYSPGSFVPASYGFSGGYECTYFMTSTTMFVANVAANSINVLSKPYKIFITYEQ